MVKDSDGYYLDDNSCGNEDIRCAAMFSRPEYAQDAYDVDDEGQGRKIKVCRVTLILHEEPGNV